MVIVILPKIDKSRLASMRESLLISNVYTILNGLYVPNNFSPQDHVNFHWNSIKTFAKTIENNWMCGTFLIKNKTMVPVEAEMTR